MSKKKIKMFVAVPTTGSVLDSQVHQMRVLEERYADEIEFIYPPKCVRRIFHDFARNCMVEEFLESGADVMWFLDSDILPPSHVLDLITLHWDKWSLAGAPYPVFMQPPGYDGPQVVFTVYAGDKDVMYPTSIPESGTAFVNGVATGCLFIKRHVFDSLQKPYFEFKYRQEDRLLTEGEDLGFCKKVTGAGFKFFIDFSMVCGHEKKVNLVDVANYAVNFAKLSVDNYDKQVREPLRKLEEQLRLRKEQRASQTPAPSVVWRPR